MFASWAKVAPDRVSRPRDRSAFEAVCEAGFDPAVVCGAALRFVAESPDVKARRVLALERWLCEQRFEGWIGVGGSPGAPPLAAGFDGPADVRAAVAAAKGEAFAATYLDPAGWRGEGRQIVARTRIAADRLRSSASGVLRSLKVSVVDPQPTTQGNP
jgi:hypothetical protein